eukprot:6171916-Pleurochrysis_carterae.AAC.5
MAMTQSTNHACADAGWVWGGVGLTHKGGSRLHALATILSCTGTQKVTKEFKQKVTDLKQLGRSCAAVLCVRVRPSFSKARQQHAACRHADMQHCTCSSFLTLVLTHAFASTQPRHMRPPAACTQAAHPPCRASTIPTRGLGAKVIR